MKKIVFLNIFSGIGGAEKVLLDCVSFAREAEGKAQAVLFKDGPLREKLVERGAAVEIIPAPQAFLSLTKEGGRVTNAWRALVSLPRLLVLFFRLRSFIQKNGAEVIFGNSFKCHFLAGLLGKTLRKKVVIFSHDFLPRQSSLRKFTAWFYFRFTDLILTNSLAVKNDLTQAWKRRTGPRVEVLYCPFRTDRPTPSTPVADIRRKYGFSENDIIIGSLGMLVPWKGQEFLIRAMPAILVDAPNAKLAIAGDEIYDTNTPGSKAHLKGLVKELGLEGKVSFLGFVPDPDEALSMMDVFVHTSVRPEPFGMVIVEAILANVPVIAANAGGVPEIIDHGRTGLLVSPGDPAAIADAVVETCRGREAAMGRAKAAKKDVVEKFSYPVIKSRFISIMNDIIK